jgi:hypothetical protein
MVSPILKVLAAETSVGTAGSTLNGHQLIRVYNSTASDVLVTIKNASDVTTGSFTLKTYTEAFVRKLPAESISASATVKMAPVSF